MNEPEFVEGSSIHKKYMYDVLYILDSYPTMTHNNYYMNHQPEYNLMKGTLFFISLKLSCCGVGFCN